ncbi:hypothetical protein Poly41_48830 [Novipirellula artificiosorum]|uniref:Helix-turn-helix domain-containing protein n=1 Tax=Novipirellula artificiosorum TaxID=2528016 RepID=A0A5C6D9S9_9BACT|nr:hypothetical protein Poly41_48830 [Novipirellula artificiosorum]
MATSKSKSQRRFEQLNHIVDKLLRQLPARHGVAMLVCYRHAQANRQFRVSESDLAIALGVDRRTARRLFDDLERWQAIKLVKPKQGTIPRVFVITGKVISEDTTAPTKARRRSHVQ